MLELKNEDSEEARAAAVTRTEAATTAGALALQSNDELLSELEQLVAVGKQSRKGVAGVLFAGLTVSAASIGASLVTLGFGAHPQFGLYTAALVGSVALVPLTMGAAFRLGRSFYHRSREQIAALVPELAARGDMRALPLLLSLMGQRMSGVFMWRESRPVLLAGLESLLRRITPDEFRDISHRQIYEIMLMLYYPDGQNQSVTAEAIVRCGDHHTLEALTGLQHLTTTGSALGKTPLVAWNPVVWYMTKQGVPLATPEVKLLVDRTVDRLSVEIAEWSRTAELLRASERSGADDGSELVRPAASTASGAGAGELVRPFSGEPEGADR